MNTRISKRTINLKQSFRDLEHINCLELSNCKKICYVAGDLKLKHNSKCSPIFVIDITNGTILSKLNFNKRYISYCK